MGGWGVGWAVPVSVDGLIDVEENTYVEVGEVRHGGDLLMDRLVLILDTILYDGDILDETVAQTDSQKTHGKRGRPLFIPGLQVSTPPLRKYRLLHPL